MGYAALVKPTDIEAAALKLEPKERARLAESLLASLDSVSDADAEKLWLREAERRERELTEDPSIGIDAAHAMRESRALLE